MKVSRRSRIWIAVSVAAFAAISAGTLWGWSQWKEEQARAQRAEIVRRRELRIEAGAEKARRVIDAMELPDMWSGADSWRVKQWTAAAELHCTPDQLRNELGAAYAEARSVAPAPSEVLRLQRFQRWTEEEVTARKHSGQAGELAFALMHFVEAEQYMDRAVALAATDGDYAEALRWQEKTADVRAASGGNAAEMDRRRSIEEWRRRLWLPDPSPAVTVTKMALCWRRGGKPDTGFSILDNFLKAYPPHLDAAHPEVLFVLGVHTELLCGRRDGAQLPEAEAEMRHALTESERVYGRDSSQAAVATLRLARILATEGRQADADAALGQAKSLCEKNFGPEHPLTAAVLFTQALNLSQAGEVEGAGKLLEQVLEADEKCFLPDSMEIAEVLFQLGVVAFRSARLADAQRYLRGSLDIAERLAGSKFPLVVSARGALAKVEESLGTNPGAQLNTREALVGLAASHPEDPGTLIVNLATAGVLQLQNGKYREAEKTLRHALDIARKNPQNPRCNGLAMALALHNLGWCLIFSQQWMEAEADLREALAIEEKIQGPNHPDQARTLTDLAEVLFDEDRPAEAGRLLDRAMNLCKPGSGPMPPETLNTLTAIGRNLCRFERFTEALPLQRLLVENARTNYGRESYSYGSALYNLGKTEEQLGHLDEAEHAFEEAVPIGEKLTQGSLIVAEWQTELARCYASQHKLAEAELLFRKSVLNLLGAAKEMGTDPENLGLYLEWYSQHLQVMGLTREQIAERIDHLRQGERMSDL